MTHHHSPAKMKQLTLPLIECGTCKGKLEYKDGAVLRLCLDCNGKGHLVKKECTKQFYSSGLDYHPDSCIECQGKGFTTSKLPNVVLKEVPIEGQKK